ncbi:PDR/VanB family oxidoreductase [Paraglaciecola sp. L3A3]|uniref:PDR/VanB family oxidoreductase n=1 Tax=Paraglaciecola sp. L3A3 TaxID=2686358 RepID=UPI00131E1FDF|nr:PDR/VanB family oxidoreductase [Paraglaciecola sp. L3A3]
MLELKVVNVWQDGEGVRLFDLRPLDTSTLPEFTPGAHIDVKIAVQTGDDITRQYSLCNHPDERHRYVIAIALAADSKGGSKWLHGSVNEGDILSVSQPRNHFMLADETSHSILIAGGIGITPILTMAYGLEQQGKSWELHFTARSASKAPLLNQIMTLQDSAKLGRVYLYYTRETPANRLDFNKILSSAPANSHFYCCGPNALLQSYNNSLAHLPADKVHFEHFQSEHEVATEGGYTIELSRSGKELVVPKGSSVLDVLKQNSINITYACAEGVCGSCEVQVISGIPDHRDMVLSDDEKSENSCMMVCCSGSLSERLVLDL